MKVGYARVSTDDQNLHLQLDALRNAECHRVFTDHGMSGADFSRSGLNQALANLKAGDTLVVWRLDRLGRSLSKLVNLIDDLGKRGVEFVSLTESIMTHTPGGMLIFHLMAALAEFERALISERTRAGIAAARARGKRMGRKPALTAAQQTDALRLLKTETLGSVARRFNIHPRTLKRLSDAVQQQSASRSQYVPSVTGGNEPRSIEDLGRVKQPKRK
ncbi:recombinase family protein [Burkholderia ubonensis]|uniref:recombinase family protein n=1 Tax=Burkholderia ubonensis TaxID=101571 RepID=UPI0007C65B8E|nr:recombinase family protein [Burkholderia ubonensis]